MSDADKADKRSREALGVGKDILALGIRGGRGKCNLCGEWHNNVAYHRANECKEREK